MLLEDPLSFFSDLLMGNWESLNSIIWFLPALFSLNILFFIFEKLKNKGRVFMIILSVLTFILSSEIMALHYSIPFGVDVALYLFSLAFVIKCIYFYRTHLVQYANLTIFSLIIFSVFILFYFEPIKTHTKYHNIIDLAQFSVPVTFVGYFSYILLNSSIFILFLKIKESKTLANIGHYSFPIFLLHLIVMSKISNLVKFENDFFKVGLLLFVFILSIILPILISKLLMKLSVKFKYIGFTN